MTARLVDTPVIETERLILRGPRMEDFPAWEAFYTSPRAQYIGGPGDTGLAWRAFCHVTGMWALRGFGSFIFTLKDSDAPIGMSGPWYPANWPEHEIGWTIWSAEGEGKGYAAEAATAARDYAYRSLGWTTAVSYIEPENARSIALAERLGARLDPNAASPGDYPTVVYRHPAPEALA